MRAMLVSGAVVILVAFAKSASAADAAECEAARCAAMAAIEARCPCDAATNHGRHVSCVAHVVRELWKKGDVPTNCKGKVTRCAARSVCGKAGAVTCLRPVYGLCDLANGTCADDPETACLVDTDCVIATRCSTKRSAERCEEAGGTVGASATCCANCLLPPP